jgi:very-short-patch-repair endonuclease
MWQVHPQTGSETVHEHRRANTIHGMDEFMSVGEAAARGITRGILRTSAWDHISHDLYGPAGSADALRDRCRALRRVLPPGAAFSHFTLARLLDLWLPRLPDWLPVQATLPPGAVRPERSGLWVARSRARLHRPIAFEDLLGVPIPAMIGQLAEDLTLLDLVVAIDCVLHRSWCSVTDIRRGIKPRQRGAPRLRAALELVDARSESPWETILRLLLVLCGFDVEPQRLINDAAGRFVARGDIWLPGTRRILEYDGEHHRDRAHHRADLAREKDLSRIDWERYGYSKPEIVDTPRQIIRDAETAYGMAHDPNRLAAWWPVFEESTLSQSGWNRLLHRLHRFTGQGGRTPRQPRLRDGGGLETVSGNRHPAIAVEGAAGPQW